MRMPMPPKRPRGRFMEARPLPRLAVVLSAILAGLVLAACAGRAIPPDGAGEPGLELTILHTNDTHAHIAGIDSQGNAAFDEAESRGGLGRIAAMIREAGAAGDNVLALDAGDQCQGTLFHSVNGWKLVSEVDAIMPWHAVTLGNHEFDGGCGPLAEFLGTTRMPVLAANLRPKPGCPLAGAAIRPHMVFQVRGVPVGVVGIANDEVVEISGACPRTEFADRVETLRREVAGLQARGVRHIVALTHIGLSEDRKLARAVDGVDVIVGGHSHSLLGPGSEEGPYPIVERSPSGRPVLVVTAGRAAQYLGRLAVRFDGEGVPVSWHGQAEEPANSRPSDPAMARLIRKLAGTLEEQRGIILGRHDLVFPDGLDACRAGECLGALVTVDAMREFGLRHGAGIALLNGGAVRAALPRGRISRGDLLAMHPFGNVIVLREYDGARLLAALEHGVSGENGRGPRLLHVAGLRYVVDPARPAGSRVLKAEVADGRGAFPPLNPGRRYRVILTEYLAGGGDGFGMLRDGRPLPFPAPTDVDLPASYIRRHSPLSMPAAGRIRFVRRTSAGAAADAPVRAGTP